MTLPVLLRFADADSVFKPMMILVGDSITERGFEDSGWGLLLTEDYNRKVGGFTQRAVEREGWF